MIYYDRIDVCKGIHFYKTIEWKHVCNMYHGLLMIFHKLAILLF